VCRYYKSYLFYLLNLCIFFSNINAQEINPKKKLINKEKFPELIWEEKKEKNINPLLWEIDDKQSSKEFEEEDFELQHEEIYDFLSENDLDLEILDYGYAVPSANSIFEDELRLEIGQVSSFSSGNSGGIGNQNYFSRVYYGINDSTSFSIFFTEADDPLYSKINSQSNETSNLWTNFGASFKKIIYEKEKNKLAIEASIERWRVKSGGCNGFGCDKTNPSHNIFNGNLEIVDNTNTISSIALPITRKFNKNFEYSFSPKYTFLPSQQNNGKFFGNNFGLGLGGKYSFNKKFRINHSIYFPIGAGDNNFNNELNFRKKLIHHFGASYSFDPEIALEAYLTNSFGSSPATSILTMPSSNQIIYGGRLTYTPNFYYGYKKDENDELFKKTINQGNFVSTAFLLNKGEKSFEYAYSNNGSDFYKIIFGLSESFNLDFSSEMIDSKNIFNNKFKKTFLTNSSRSARGGGTLKIFSQERGDLISTNLRLSFGRVLAATRAGYMFGELINTYSINQLFSFNLNPRFSMSGDGNIYSIGTSFNWKLNPRIEIIPEANIALNNSENNFSITGRSYLSEHVIIDSFISNSFGQTDMAQQLKNATTKYGIKLRVRF
tara:strand:- start:1682 stop:3499 length:1818 start_codon:yes stop_codon:yes gene_type:complete